MTILAFSFLFAFQPSSHVWQGNHAVTSIQFNYELIKDLGLTVAAEVVTAAPYRANYLGFQAEPDSFISIYAPEDHFEWLQGGYFSHIGGFVFERQGQVFSFIDFVLRAVPGTTEFELYDDAGRRLFTLAYAHGYFDPAAREMTVLNMDMNISPEFAQRLGQPALEGTFVGSVDVTFALTPPERYQPSTLGECIATFVGDIDVQLDAMGTLSQAAREPGGRVSMAPSASLSNQGTADVRWYNAIAPSPDPGQHPYLVIHMYRIADGKFEMIGKSDVKHAFFSVNSGCPCPGGHVLYVGCGDTYGSGTNLNRNYLAPREEVTAGTGTWVSLGSHFDVYPGFFPADDFRSHGGDPEHDNFEHRLVVTEPDMQVAGAQYFAEAWYITQGDVDIYNSMGWRQVTPTLTTVWTFAYETDLAHGPALEAWVPLGVDGSNAVHEEIDSGEGHLRVAANVEDLGGGMFHYEYVVLNLDFDRQIESLSLPISSEVTVSNLSFSDVDANAGNDWVASVAGDGVTWNAVAGGGLDWGTAYRFGFDADAPAVNASAVLGVKEAGSPTELNSAVLVPEVPCQPSDLTEAFPNWPVMDVIDLIQLICLP